MPKFDPSSIEIWNFLKQQRLNIDVAKTYTAQVLQIDNLLNNDKTGLVSTILDFMIHSATVDMKIETKVESLNSALQDWQKKTLNRKVNIDIPAGLRELSTEYFRERWRSSQLALKVIWGEEKFANQGSIIVPKKMWFLNGGSVSTEPNKALNTRKFYLGTGKEKIELTNGVSESIYIRKPYTSWHKDQVTPYLVRRGTLFNALLKNAIVQKQSDVVEAILPILLKLQAGTDNLALEGLNPKEKDFQALIDQLTKAKDKFENNGNFGDIIASLRHDVNIDYLIPDLSRIFDEKITKPVDRNILSSLGLVELKGFSSTREEAILNPKVLVEEIVDAVNDWASLLEDIMFEMMERNKVKHPTLASGEIQVIPGTIKSFITDEMRTMLRSLYDRGILSKQNASEDIANLNFEVQVNRREKENERELDKTMMPPVIQNLEQYQNPDLIENPDLENQDKKPGTPEADNFNNAVLKSYFGRKHLKKKKKKDEEYSEEDNQEKIEAPFNTIDDLPKNVKDVLPVQAQIIWLKVFNSVFEETGDEERAIRSAWSKVSEKYEKDPDSKKWKKKASLTDYEANMSPYAYKLFTDIFEIAIDQGNPHSTSLNTALKIVEKICVKNNDGIFVKDKTINKAKLDQIQQPDYVNQIISLEMNEKKLKLLDKLLNDEDE